EQIYAPAAARTEPTREQVVGVWQRLSADQQALLRELAIAGGELTQDGLLSKLAFLQGKSKRLGRLKSSINAACDAAGIVRILLEGVGKGKAQVHALSKAGPRVLAWVTEQARAPC